MTQRQILIPETGGSHRMGRHVNHDEQSKNFPAPRGVVQDVLHKCHTKPFDQGQLGSCTGNAMAGLLDTDPLFVKGRYLYEGVARSLYSLATHIDPFPGAWKPTDTGSDGLSVMKAAQQRGYITSYAHAFGLQHALEALALTGVITGCNFYDSMENPDSTGLVTISPNAQVIGGHEWLVRGIDVERQRVRCRNSWGTEWGDGGYFDLSFSDWDRLLNEHGDVTVGQA